MSTRARPLLCSDDYIEEYGQRKRLREARRREREARLEREARRGLCTRSFDVRGFMGGDAQHNREVAAHVMACWRQALVMWREETFYKERSDAMMAWLEAIDEKAYQRAVRRVKAMPCAATLQRCLKNECHSLVRVGMVLAHLQGKGWLAPSKLVPPEIVWLAEEQEHAAGATPVVTSQERKAVFAYLTSHASEVRKAKHFATLCQAMAPALPMPPAVLERLVQDGLLVRGDAPELPTVAPGLQFRAPC